MCEPKHFAYKTYNYVENSSFEFWWENTGKLLINPKTPKSIVESFKEIAEHAWNRSAIIQDECTDAVIGHPYVAIG